MNKNAVVFILSGCDEFVMIYLFYYYFFRFLIGCRVKLTLGQKNFNKSLFIFCLRCSRFFTRVPAEMQETVADRSWQLGAAALHHNARAALKNGSLEEKRQRGRRTNGSPVQKQRRRFTESKSRVCKSHLRL